MLRIATIFAAATLALTAPAAAQTYPWKPERPITIIVPWAAGGSTDQVTRVAAIEIEKALGQKVVIVNQGGASGSIGTKTALEAAKDGYTWTAGAAKDIGTYAVSGLLDTKIDELQRNPDPSKQQLAARATQQRDEISQKLDKAREITSDQWDDYKKDVDDSISSLDKELDIK